MFQTLEYFVHNFPAACFAFDSDARSSQAQRTRLFQHFFFFGFRWSTFYSSICSKNRRELTNEIFLLEKKSSNKNETKTKFSARVDRSNTSNTVDMDKYMSYLSNVIMRIVRLKAHFHFHLKRRTKNVHTNWNVDFILILLSLRIHVEIFQNENESQVMKIFTLRQNLLSK